MSVKIIHIRYADDYNEVITLRYITVEVFHQETVNGVTTIYLDHKPTIMIPFSRLIDIIIEHIDQKVDQKVDQNG